MSKERALDLGHALLAQAVAYRTILSWRGVAINPLGIIWNAAPTLSGSRLSEGFTRIPHLNEVIGGGVEGEMFGAV